MLLHRDLKISTTFVSLFLIIYLLNTTKTLADQQPPKAPKEEKELIIHNDTRIDPYFWLKERDDPKVLAYLEAENKYNEQMTKHTEEFQKALFEEMKSRIKEDDNSVPYKYNGYWYITKYVKGGDYPIYTRKKAFLENKEEVLIDGNKEAEGESFYQIVGLSVSPNNKYISFGVDTVGRREYSIRIKNIETQEFYPEVIAGVTGSSTWSEDNQTLFYTYKDPKTLRSYQIRSHKIGTDPSQDKVVYEEKDDTFSTYVYKTKSRAYIIIGSSSTMTSEFRYIKSDQPDSKFEIFYPRQRGLEYSIAHYDTDFYILTNADKATNFKLMKTPVGTTDKSYWDEVIAHRKDVLIEDFEIFDHFLVVNERSNGLTQIKISSWDKEIDYYLPFTDETYTADIGINTDFDSKILRYHYNSMTTPSSVIDMDMFTQEKEVKKQQVVLDSSFKPENYESKRLWATATDGTKIPMSIVYKKGIQLNGENPVLQYGYGSYGATIDPYFSSIRLSLLNRGFVFAIAHIRGGEYLGRPWYEDGKLLNKKNTFTDFIACSKYLISLGYTSSKHLYAMGGSAGGLLMGAVINMNPELYNGVISAVPFVDVITTMLDDTIPLTTGEYDEWGNPNELDFYEYIKSYSPYDQVKKQDYPNLLVTTGYHDSQVQYWEPAKWVAKLRELKTDDNKLLFHTNMDAGHGGASGRFEALKEVAEEYAFLLDLEGITK